MNKSTALLVVLFVFFSSGCAPKPSDIERAIIQTQLSRVTETDTPEPTATLTQSPTLTKTPKPTVTPSLIPTKTITPTHTPIPVAIGSENTQSLVAVTKLKIGGGKKVISINWSDDGRHLFALTENFILNTFDISENKVIGRVELDPANEFRGFTISGDGKTIAIFHDEGVQLINALKGNTIAQIHLRTKPDDVNFSLVEKKLVIAMGNGLYIWDIAKEELVTTIEEDELTFWEQAAFVERDIVIAVACVRSQTWGDMSECIKGVLVKWNIDTGSKEWQTIFVNKRASYSFQLEFSTDMRSLLVYDTWFSGFSPSLFNVENGKLITKLDVVDEEMGLNSIRLNVDGKVAAVSEYKYVSFDNSLEFLEKLVDTTTGKTLKEFPNAGGAADDWIGYDFGFSTYYGTLVFNHDDTLLASGRNNGIIEIFMVVP